MKIQLLNVGKESRSVQVLLGSDAIGKLMTGQRRILSCGLVAMETIILMDSVSCGRLDFGDTKIPAPKPKRSFMKPHEHFLRTVKVDEEERFLVSLPWRSASMTVWKKGLNLIELILHKARFRIV
ncbi:hypothetical protein TNIN_124171 [Trichonephila inaurata madagascariensis]|uniref:Uncharacterized protein n=1 Tax=Trichonephila inaurata madagascariensis TaxID=2747483 RepID=A0A8X6YGK7_9ARAC|nr:hypothetical protein TNIN_124171 [Trichonephila inaurata madagascariensis]